MSIGLGPEGLALGRRAQFDATGLPGLHGGRDLLERFPLQLHRAGFDELLQVASGKLGHQGGQRAVEPLAVLRRVDDEGAQFAGLDGVGALLEFSRLRGLGDFEDGAQGVGRYN
jgi:hypothetical protein